MSSACAHVNRMSIRNLKRCWIQDELHWESYAGSEERLWQGEDHDLIGRDHRHVLLSVLRLVGDRVGVADRLELRDPELLAGLRMERTETAIVGGADEHQSARRDGRTRAAAAADVLLPWWQVLVDA